ncbi:MAG: hypothetical protein GU356_11070 [Pyrobaculum sp.]|nr:hypothetical protein [Pyrobaculum sp.]
MEGLWPLLKAVHLLSFAVWTAAGLGAYLVVRDICNDDVLAKYRRVAHLQALALAALGATGLTMAHMLGFPSWTEAAALLSGPLVVLELLHISATENCTKLNRWVNVLTPMWTLLLAVILYLKLYKPTLAP